MQAALVRLNDELDRTWGVRLANRTGVNTGEVVTGDSSTAQRLVTGDAVNTAARLEQAAPANEILLGELTYRLVRDAVEVEAVEPLELKGKAERVPAWRLLAVHSGIGAARGRCHADGGTGTGDGHACAARSGPRPMTAGSRMVTIIGDAGVGKSRLTREFLASVA